MNGEGIRVDSLSFSYPDGTVALDDVSFSVQPSDIFALLGRGPKRLYYGGASYKKLKFPTKGREPTVTQSIT